MRLTAGVLGLVVALPVILAAAVLMVVAWTGTTPRLWLVIPPLVILGALLIAVAIRALRAGRATVPSLAVMGVTELVLGIVVLAATSPLTGGAVTGGVVAFVAAGFSFAAAVRTHLTGGTAVSTADGAAPISISIRKPGATRAGGAKGPTQRPAAKNRSKGGPGKRKR